MKRDLGSIYRQRCILSRNVEHPPPQFGAFPFSLVLSSQSAGFQAQLSQVELIFNSHSSRQMQMRIEHLFFSLSPSPSSSPSSNQPNSVCSFSLLFFPLFIYFFFGVLALCICVWTLVKYIYFYLRTQKKSFINFSGSFQHVRLFFQLHSNRCQIRSVGRRFQFYFFCLFDWCPFRVFVISH